MPAITTKRPESRPDVSDVESEYVLAAVLIVSKV